MTLIRLRAWLVLVVIFSLCKAFTQSNPDISFLHKKFSTPSKFLDFAPLLEEFLKKCDLSTSQLLRGQGTLESKSSCFEQFLSSGKSKVFANNQFLENVSVVCDLRGCFLDQTPNQYFTERFSRFSCAQKVQLDAENLLDSLDCVFQNLAYEEARGSIDLESVRDFKDIRLAQETAFALSADKIISVLSEALENLKRGSQILDYRISKEGWVLSVQISLRDGMLPITKSFVPSIVYLFDDLRQEEQTFRKILTSGLEGQIFYALEPSDAARLGKSALLIDGYNLLFALQDALEYKQLAPEASLKDLFSRRLSLKLFGPSYAVIEDLARAASRDFQESDFEIASSEPLYDAPRNSLVAVLKGFDYSYTSTANFNFIFYAPRFILDHFGFFIAQIDFTTFREFQEIPPTLRRVVVTRVNNSFDVQLNVQESDLDQSLGSLGFLVNLTALAGSLFADLHGGGGGPSIQPSFPFYSVKMDQVLNQDPELDFRQKVGICCLLGLWTARQFKYPLDYSHHLNHCVNFAKSASYRADPSEQGNVFTNFDEVVKIELKRECIRFWDPETSSFTPCSFTPFFACTVSMKPQALHRNKSLVLQTNCHAGYHQVGLGLVRVSQPVASRASSWHMANVRDLIMPVCHQYYWNRRENVQVETPGLCSVSLTHWFDWLMALDLLGFSFVKNLQTEELQATRVAGLEGASLSRGELNEFDTNEVCDGTGLPRLYPHNIHLISHNHLNNYSLAFDGSIGSRPNLLYADLDKGCERSLPPRMFPVAIAGIGNFGFARGQAPTLPLPNFPRLDSYRFFSRSVQGSIEARGTYYRAAIKPARNNRDYFIAATGFNNPLPNESLNFVTNLMSYGGFVERGNPSQHVEFNPTVLDVNIFDSSEQDPDLRNSVIINFTSPLDEYNAKVIVPESIPLRDSSGNLIRGNRQTLDLKQYLLVDSSVIEDRTNRGVQALIFRFRSDPRVNFRIMPRETWQLPWEDFKKKFSLKDSSLRSQFDWPYFFEIHISGINRLKESEAVFVNFVGNATRRYSDNFSLSESAVTKRKWSWPLGEPNPSWITNPPPSLADKLTFLRSPLYKVGLGKLFAGDSPLNELSGNIGGLLWRNRQKQEVFILRVPILPVGTQCILSSGCKRVNKNGGCSRPQQLSGDEKQEPEECIVKICGYQPNNEDEPGKCVGIDFEDSSQDERGPIEKCELGQASCCPGRDQVAQAECGETLYCRVGGPFQSEEEKENFKRQCEQEGGVFHPHCKFNGWWSRCCGEEGTSCSRTAQGGCCPSNGEGGTEGSENECDGPPWEAEQVELSNGEIVKCAKEEEYCPSTSNTTNCQNNLNASNSSNNANSANSANQANLQNSSNIRNRGPIQNLRAIPFQNLTNVIEVPIFNINGGNNQNGWGYCWFSLSLKNKETLRKDRVKARKLNLKALKTRGFKRVIERYLARTMPCPTPVVGRIDVPF